jgi:hypothetical protein
MILPTELLPPIQPREREENQSQETNIHNTKEVVRPLKDQFYVVFREQTCEYQLSTLHCIYHIIFDVRDTEALQTLPESPPRPSNSQHTYSHLH